MGNPNRGLIIFATVLGVVGAILADAVWDNTAVNVGVIVGVLVLLMVAVFVREFRRPE
jgi:uncharacterized membrane protein YeaQ/YmgE (transglycosylase-associated protein family)